MGKRDDDKEKKEIVNRQNKGNNCGVVVSQSDRLGLGYWLVNPPIYNKKLILRVYKHPHLEALLL